MSTEGTTTGRRPTHRACFIEEYVDREGNKQAKFHEICAIRESEKGNLAINIPSGMSLTGKIIVMPIKEKQTGGLDNHAYPEVDTPF